MEEKLRTALFMINLNKTLLRGKEEAIDAKLIV